MHILHLPTSTAGNWAYNEKRPDLTSHDIYQKGLTLMQVRTGGVDGPDFITAIKKVLPDVNLLVDVNISEDDIGDYAMVGATAVIVSTAILENNDQPMNDIITRARALQKAWQQARS